MHAVACGAEQDVSGYSVVALDEFSYFCAGLKQGIPSLGAYTVAGLIDGKCQGAIIVLVAKGYNGGSFVFGCVLLCFYVESFAGD